jgi:SAM-dependent methyltransferase
MSTSIDDLKNCLRLQVQGALSLNIAYVGVVNGLFGVIHELGSADSLSIARAAHVDPDYVNRWCDAAYAAGYLDVDGAQFRLTPLGRAMRPDAPEALFPMAVQSVLSAHMAERAAGLMRTGERPGESVLAERETVLPWFGPMLEASFAPLFESTICPGVPAFAEVDARGGLAVDLGCGNGWYLRAMARRCHKLRGLGVDGFEENIVQARRLAAEAGLDQRLSFMRGNIHGLALEEPADLIAMNRALHHVWEKGSAELFGWLRANLKPRGFVVIWEPAWPDDRATLRDQGRQSMAFQNLSEHVQGNHFLRPQEIQDAFTRAGMASSAYLFAQGNEAVVVAQL